MKHESLLFGEGWGRSPEANLAHDAPVSARYNASSFTCFGDLPKGRFLLLFGCRWLGYSSERGAVNEVDRLESVRMVLRVCLSSNTEMLRWQKNNFGIPISKETLNDIDFNRRVEEVLGENLRRDLHVQICDFSTADEAEALGMILTFRRAFSEEGHERYVFRIDRQSVQDLIDALYDLVKYEKSEAE